MSDTKINYLEPDKNTYRKFHQAFVHVRRKPLNVAFSLFRASVPDFLKHMKEMLLFRVHSKWMTKYYLGRVRQILEQRSYASSFEEILEGYQYVVDYLGEEAIDHELYIMLYKAFARYYHNTKQKESVFMYLVLNLILDFRDFMKVWLSKTYVIDNIVKHASEIENFGADTSYDLNVDLRIVDSEYKLLAYCNNEINVNQKYTDCFKEFGYAPKYVKERVKKELADYLNEY